MKISNRENRQQSEYLEKLNREQKHKIASRQQEIENISKLYDQKVEDERLEGEKRVWEAQDRNQKEIIEASTGKQQKLESYRAELQETKRHLDTERQNLIDQHQEKLGDMGHFYDQKYRTQFDEAENLSREINERVNNDIKNLESKTDNTITDLQYKTKLSLDEAASRQKLKLQKKEGEYLDARRRKEVEFAQLAAKNELAQGRRMKEMMQKNEREMLNRDRIHQDTIKAKDRHFEAVLKGIRQSFKQKYEHMIKEHKLVYDNLKSRFDAEIKSLIESNARQKEMVSAKINDPFYGVERLRPEIKDAMDHYLVAIEVPEHEKESFNLSAQGRVLKMSYTRRSENRLEDADGSINHSRRSEAVTREFNVPDITTSKNMSQKYEDGMLIYKVMKA